MNNLEAQLALKKRLPRTWMAFFGQYGNFTPTQLAAIPGILDGRNVILGAPTASGKTEAVLSPLVERHCLPISQGLDVLYLVPTRALANDLQQRLTPIFDALRLSLSVKTHDLKTFDPENPARLLITTPESTDSLLTSRARVFANLRAVVLDELHVFDGTPRGDHLRVILNRLREIRSYASTRGDSPDTTVQYVGVSATLANPQQVATRYFSDAEVVQVQGKRQMQAELIELTPEEPNALLEYLWAFKSRGWRKAVVFCDSRQEIEGYAAVVRGNSPFGNAVYVHYSNIESKRRFEIEQRFATDEAAICFATSTLELGIDVGSIDVVILIGAPGDHNAFVQRIGRGNRRGQHIQVACFYRSVLEKLLFEVLLADQNPIEMYSAFRPAVVVQQIFSIIKQSPQGSVRLNKLIPLFENLLSPDDLGNLLGYLIDLDYLKPGRPGAWVAGTQLNQLYDEQAQEYVPLSIYSNIEFQDSYQTEVRDQYTGQIVARVRMPRRDQSSLTLEGRHVKVEWRDRKTLWVATDVETNETEKVYYTGRKLLSYEVACLLPQQLGFASSSAPVVQLPDGWLVFHWLGDLYGRMLLDLLHYQMQVSETAQPGLSLFLHDKPSRLPNWSAEQVMRYVQDNYHRLEHMIMRGAFYALLPAPMRRRTVVDQVNIPRFVRATMQLKLIDSLEMCVDETVFDQLIDYQ